MCVDHVAFSTAGGENLSLQARSSFVCGSNCTVDIHSWQHHSVAFGILYLLHRATMLATYTYFKLCYLYLGVCSLALMKMSMLRSPACWHSEVGEWRWGQSLFLGVSQRNSSYECQRQWNCHFPPPLSTLAQPSFPNVHPSWKALTSIEFGVKVICQMWYVCDNNKTTDYICQ